MMSYLAVPFYLKNRNSHFDNPFLQAGNFQIIEALGYGKWRDHPLIKESRARFLDLPARDLLGAYRFDIAIKAHYARLSWKGMAKAWREHAYAEQALRITGPDKEIRGNMMVQAKPVLMNFLVYSKGLYVLMIVGTFPHVPLDENLIAMDGAHRIAASIVRGNSVRAIQIDSTQNMPSTALYYAGLEHGHDPCDPDVLDAGAVEYCRIHHYSYRTYFSICSFCGQGH